MGGQAGGLARRAALLEKLRQEREGSILLELGNLADVGAKHEPVLDVAALMKYDGVSLSEADVVLTPAVSERARAKGVPVVPQLAPASTKPTGGLVVVRGGSRIALAALSRTMADEPAAKLAGALRSLRRQAEVVVLVSYTGLEADKRLARAPETGGLIDVILEADEIRFQTEPIVVGTTGIFTAARGGKCVGEISVEFANGKPTLRQAVHQVEPSLTPHPGVYERMSAFLAAQPEHKSVAGEPLPPGLWGYAPASMCVECHQPQTAAWRKTRHAHSVQTLQREGRVLPECLTCHSEYFRMTNQFALLPAGEDGVQCATCHGDSLLHSVSSRKAQVFRKVPEDLCRSCHNQERDPDFDYAKALERIRHW